MTDTTLFLLSRGQAIDPTVSSVDAAMEAIDSVLKLAYVKRCGKCKVNWTAPVTACPECGEEAIFHGLDSDLCRICGLFKRGPDVIGDSCTGHV